MSASVSGQALFKRLAETQRERVTFTLDGQVLDALLGDTVMTAVLTHADVLCHSEASGAARAGFCLMGACQDCWISSATGARFRACSTLIEPGMQLLTRKTGAA